MTSADGLEVVSETLGLLVQGEFGLGRIPPPDAATPETGPPAHSKYGLFPSLLPLPSLAVAWPLRGLLGARGLDAVVATTWTLGVLLAGLAFGRLVRTLRNDAAGPWEAAFVAGTFLWPYAADSFAEPYAAAGLAAGAALALSGRAAGGAALWGAACLLKPVLWTTAPVFLLAVLLAERAAGLPRVLVVVGVLLAFLGAQGAANLARGGSFFATGYGDEALRFTTPLGAGLYGLVLSPGRSVFLFAPAALVALFGLRRLPRAAVVLLAGVPLVLVLVVARWWSWEGGGSWGPRHLLPALPLLVAPAVLAGRAAARAAFLVGALVNVPGVLVSPGSWAAYAETLRPPAGAAWPAMGLFRAATVPVLSPVLGHAWLAARDLFGAAPPAPWLSAGATETLPPPDAAASISPWAVRFAAGLPPVPPMLPRLLVRSAAGDLGRGRNVRAERWAREALRLAPRDPDAIRFAALAARAKGD